MHYLVQFNRLICCSVFCSLTHLSNLAKMQGVIFVSNEYEIISHSRTSYINIFVVHLVSRTPHIHRDLELGIVLEGVLSVRTGGRTYNIGKDDAYIINSMEAHEFVSGKGALVLALQFAPAPFDSFIQSDERRRFNTAPPIRDHFSKAEGQYELLLSLCSALATDHIKGESEFRCLAMAACLYNLLNETIPVQTLSNTDYVPMQRRTERLISVTDYVDANFNRKLLLEEIAEREGLSLFHLSHLFKDTLGMSFQAYIKKKRFEHACMLLATTDMNILDISIDSGFSDVRYLNSMFKKEYGCTPSEYRSGLTAGSGEKDFLSESIQYFPSQEESLAILIPFHKRFSSYDASCAFQRLFHFKD